MPKPPPSPLHRARRAIAWSSAAALLVGLLVGAPSAASAATPAPQQSVAAPRVAAAGVPAATASFRPLTPSRLLDTRAGIGAAHALVGPRQTVVLQVAGRGGVPATGVRAVTLNLTATAGTGVGFLTVFPDGSTMPETSSLNYPAGTTVANLVQAEVPADGRIRLYNSGPGSVNLIADVSGYYVAAAAPAAGLLHPVPTTRLVDTRVGLGLPGPLDGNIANPVQIAGRGPVPLSGLSAVALNLTVVSPASSGYLSAYPDGQPRPNASSLNFAAGQTVASLVLVPVSQAGRIRFYNGSGGATQVIADVVGYYLDGSASINGSFEALSPLRLLDTRSGIGAPAAPVAAARTLSLKVTGSGSSGVLAWGASAVALDVTVTAPRTSGWLTAYPAGVTRPDTSNVNFAAGQTVENTVVLPVGSDGKVQFANMSSGGVQLVVDVVGVFYDGSRTAGGLVPGQTLPSGSRLTTPHGEYLLTMQTGGDLVLTHGATQLWHSNTGSQAGARLVMTFDGRLIVFSTSDTVLWSSGPAGHSGSGMSLVMNGSLSVGLGTATLWTSGTAPVKSCSQVGPDSAGTAVTRWNPTVSCVLSMLGQSSSNIADVDIIIQYESGGDPNAINLWDSNAQAGHPSKGLIQVIQPTFDTYRSTALPNDLYDPAANLYAGLNYAIHTYGSIHNIPGLVSLRNGGGYKGYVVTR